MAGIIIDRDKCLGCGVCISSCPQNAIEMDAEGIAVIGTACTICGLCVDECPVEAIIREGMASIAGLDDLDVSHLSACRDIWVIVERRGGEIASCTFELLGEARRLVKAAPKNQVVAVLLCAEAGEMPAQLIAGGADKVLLIEDSSLGAFLDLPYKENIAALVKEEKPLAILFSATAMGRSLAPRLAACLATGLSADCTELDLRSNGMLLQTRPAFGGNLYASILCPHTWPQMATVRPKVMQPIEPDPARTGEVIQKPFAASKEQQLARLVEVITQTNESSVDEAEIVVCAGFGAASERGLALVHELAEVLGGAVGASRKVVDAGFMSYEKQIGQTGKTVGPKLYIACGISGAIQHVVGMSAAHTIVAIDMDPNSPVFLIADYGITADLYEFLPKLIGALKAHKEQQA